jgi:hypothetical protein
VVKIGGMGDHRQDVEPEFFREIVMGKHFPSEADAGRFDAECGNDMFDFRGRGDGKHVEHEKKAPDRDNQDEIAEKEHDKGYEKRESQVEADDELAPFLVGPQRRFPGIEPLGIGGRRYYLFHIYSIYIVLEIRVKVN